MERDSPGSAGPSGGVLTPAALEYIARRFGSLPDEILFEEFEGIYFHFAESRLGFGAGFSSGKARRVEMPGIKELLIRNSAARLTVPAMLVSFSEEAGSISAAVRTAGGEESFRARALVGADGADSTVREILYPGVSVGPSFRALRTRHRIIDNPLQPGWVHLWPSPRFGLFAWAHSWGESLLLGICREEGADVAELHDSLIGHLDEAHGVRLSPPDESADSRVNIGPALTGRYALGRGRAVLAGEAAGFLNPPIEGVSIALESGAAAGDAVARALGSEALPSACLRERITPLVTMCTDRWNPTRLLFGSPHDADIRAAFGSLEEDAQHAVGNELLRYIRPLRRYGWGWRLVLQGLFRVFLGRYPSGGWLQ
jgi:flavin-dependent dehydrogenase